MPLITDPEVRQVLKMHDRVQAIERAFTEEARGICSQQAADALQSAARSRQVELDGE